MTLCKLVKLLVVLVIYSIAGSYFMNNNIITHPAYWTLFGSVLGAIQTIIALS